MAPRRPTSLMLLPLLLLALAAIITAGHAAEAQAAAEALLQIWAAAEQDSDCSDTPSVTKDECLGKSAGCMFLKLDRRNLCLPCHWADADLPCPPPGAVYPQGVVSSCDMTCKHQQVLSKISDCTDVSGDINKIDCFAKGFASGTKCAWTSWRTANDKTRTMCGPCLVNGFGEVPLYVAGTAGPEPGSTVLASASQCQEAAGGRKGCFNSTGCPTLAPVPPAAGQQTGPVPLDKLGLSVPEGAPHYVAVPVAPPFGAKEYAEASEAAARAAGWWPQGSAALRADGSLDNGLTPNPSASAPPPPAAVIAAMPVPSEAPTVPPSLQLKNRPPLPGLMMPVKGQPNVRAEPGAVPEPAALISMPSSRREMMKQRRLRHA